MPPDDFPAAGYVSDYLGFWAIWLVVIVGTIAFFRVTRGRRGRVRLVAGNLLILLSFLWTAVLAAETGLRYVYDRTDQWGVTLTTIAWNRRHIAARLNSQGFRDREFTDARRPGVVRVGCVGDSFTQGWGIDDPGDAWPQRLGTLLEERRPGGFETLNLGVSGCGTREEADLVEKLSRRHVFDRVVLAYCLNDADDLLPPDKQFTAKAVPRMTWMEPTRSFLADFLWFRVRLRDDPYVAGADARQAAAYEDPVVWKAQCDRFRRIAETCRNASVALDVIVFPFFSDWGPDYRFGVCHDRVVNAWTALGVPVLDLRTAYTGMERSDLMVNRFDGHPSAKASDVAARAVVPIVVGRR